MSLTHSHLEELRSLRSKFGPAHCEDKVHVLQRFAALTPRSARTLRAYHELLLFMVAFADSASIYRAAEAELKRLSQLVADGDLRMSALHQSGIANSSVEHLYSLTASRWLASHFPSDVSILWDDALESRLESLLPALVPLAARDGLNAGLSVEEWLERVSKNHPAGAAGWLMERVWRLSGSYPLRDREWDQLEINLQWQLRGGLSRTSLRFPSLRSPFAHRSLTKKVDVLRLSGRTIPVPARLTRSQRRQLLDACRATCLVRSIETDPATYTAESDISMFTLERGVDVALFGMKPERRLPFETYIGYVVAKNGVPVGYGGGWLQFDQCAIGVHIFDTFRGGEAAYLFGQVLRVYRQQFGVSRFTVDPYQIGAGNPDGIRSGAFWFYYRLGFRPVDRELVALAEREWKEIKADRSYRTQAKILRRFANDQLALTFDARKDAFPEFTSISLAVANWIGERFSGDSDAARRWSERRVKRALDVRETSAWPEGERGWFREMCLIVAMIPDLESWSIGEKRSLVTVLRAKGGTRESSYVRRVQRHSRLRNALRSLVAVQA